MATVELTQLTPNTPNRNARLVGFDQDLVAEIYGIEALAALIQEINGTRTAAVEVVQTERTGGLQSSGSFRAVPASSLRSRIGPVAPETDRLLDT